MRKVVFVHTSKNIKGNPQILVFPMGLIALASLLKENSIESEIIHLEVEKAIDPKFNLIRYLRQNNIQIICFDLFWHHQSYKVIWIAKKIKQSLPNCNIIVGGLTASFFAKEVLDNFHAIDFIIKGDAEIPLLSLIKLLLLKRKNFASIPNLIWRNKKRVIINKMSYVISQGIINKLKFSNFNIVRNYERYNKIHLGTSKCLYCDGRECDRIFYYNCGRGCKMNCSTCSGSNISQRIISSRKQVVFINHPAVIRELRNALKYNISIWYTSFDPYPNGDYYIKLFQKIRKESLNLSLKFECWSLPTIRFLDEFSKTFQKDKSMITIFTMCGSDLVRKMNKGYYFSNDDLIKIIRYASLRNVKICLCFTIGLPFERREDVIKTLTLINFLKSFKNVEFNCYVTEIEPASPRFLEQRKYGILSSRNSFKDYYQVHRKKSGAGYSTEYFSENEINNIVKLLVAETRCKKSKSHFLSQLLNTLFASRYYNLNKIYLQCSACENFNICFKDSVCSCSDYNI